MNMRNGFIYPGFTAEVPKNNIYNYYKLRKYMLAKLPYQLLCLLSISLT